MRARKLAHCWLRLGQGVCVMASGTLRAQSDKSTIRGTVTDPSKAVVPGVEITLTEVETNVAVRTVLSDANGNFEIPDLKPGLYRLKADLAGFKAFLADAVRLDGVQTRRIDVTLEVGTMAETVTVDRKSTRLNSSHTVISYALFCLTKKTDQQ